MYQEIVYSQTSRRRRRQKATSRHKHRKHKKFDTFYVLCYRYFEQPF